LKIAIDARNLVEKGLGVGRYLEGFIQYSKIVSPDIEYTLYFNSKANRQVDGFRTKIIDVPFLKKNIFWMNVALPFELMREKYDLFHCPFYGLPYIQPCPMVVTIHDISYIAHPEWFASRTRMSFKLTTDHAIRTAKKIMTDTEFSKKEILKYYKVPEDRISVVYAATGPNFKPQDKATALKAAKGIGAASPFLLHVGAIHARRNVERALRAFVQVKKKFPDMRFILVGRQDKNIDISGLATHLGIKDSVTMIEYIDEPALVSLYNACEALVYPSLYEGFGLPVLEAMACGAPVIAANASCTPEVLGGAGVLFDPYNEVSIADTVIRVLGDNKLKSEIVAKGLKRAADFSWERAARQTVDIYRDVAGKL
jgi:glycosyltransferase involved in cell wall biosynthesis